MSTPRARRRLRPGAARIAVLVARWGGWPGWTPLYLRALAANRALVDFHLITDAPPPMAGELPPNVAIHLWSVSRLLERLRETVGCTLTELTTNGTAGRHRMSTAKVNDLKPAFGEAFADILQGYAWWGWLQEDVLLGSLASCVTPRLLREHDVISPFQPPWNSSGVFMLFRNVPRVNRLWRASTDASRVITDPSYLAFDEWWGPLADDLSAVIGREERSGTIRVYHGSQRTPPPWPGTRWFGSDHELDDPLLACWNNGTVSYALSSSGGVSSSYLHAPCLGGPQRAAAVAQRRSDAAARVCMLHFTALKKSTALGRQMPGRLPIAVERELELASEMALTRDGMWYPGQLPGWWTLVGGPHGRPQRFAPQEVGAYLQALAGGVGSNGWGGSGGGGGGGGGDRSSASCSSASPSCRAARARAWKVRRPVLGRRQRRTRLRA